MELKEFLDMPKNPSKTSLSNNAATVVCFSCRPNSGSEWGVGWNYLKMLSGIFGQVNLYLRDAENQHKQVYAGLIKENIHNVTLHLVSEMKLRNLIRTKEQHIKYLTLYYFAWLLKVLWILITQKAWRKTNYIFHITWVSDWIWSPFFILPFRRKIIGPIGSQPKNFYEKSKDKQSSIKRVIIKKSLRLQPLNWLNAFLADGVIAIADRFISNYPWALTRKKIILPPVHSELTQEALKGPSVHGPCIMFVGKNLPFKNFDLFRLIALRVKEQMPDMPILVLGDGFSTSVASSLERLSPASISALAKTEEILYLGLQKQSLLQDIYRSFDVVLLQSSSETGGTAPVEALGFGAPVVCARNHGVDAFFSGNDYRFAIPYISEDQFVSDTVKTIVTLFQTYDRKIAKKYFACLRIEQTQKKLEAFLANIG